VKLSQWRKAKGHTQAWVADRIGVHQTFISYIERATDPQIPNRDVMKAIYVLTSGSVQPNDFYDLPAWEAARIRAEAEAEMAARAA